MSEYCAFGLSARYELIRSVTITTAAYLPQVNGQSSGYRAPAALPRPKRRTCVCNRLASEELRIPRCSPATHVTHDPW